MFRSSIPKSQLNVLSVTTSVMLSRGVGPFFVVVILVLFLSCPTRSRLGPFPVLCCLSSLVRLVFVLVRLVFVLFLSCLLLLPMSTSPLSFSSLVLFSTFYLVRLAFLLYRVLFFFPCPPRFCPCPPRLCPFPVVFSSLVRLAFVFFLSCLTLFLSRLSLLNALITITE